MNPKENQIVVCHPNETVRWMFVLRMRRLAETRGMIKLLSLLGDLETWRLGEQILKILQNSQSPKLQAAKAIFVVAPAAQENIGQPIIFIFSRKIFFVARHIV